LAALRMCIALGAECYVTSSSPEKIQRAIQIGAKSGVNYKDGEYSLIIPHTIIIC
jgi:NADPH:quinone reductase-like Zn-dependent oxidoreductase